MQASGSEDASLPLSLLNAVNKRMQCPLVAKQMTDKWLQASGVGYAPQPVHEVPAASESLQVSARSQAAVSTSGGGRDGIAEKPSPPLPPLHAVNKLVPCPHVAKE